MIVSILNTGSLLVEQAVPGSGSPFFLVQASTHPVLVAVHCVANSVIGKNGVYAAVDSRVGVWIVGVDTVIVANLSSCFSITVHVEELNVTLTAKGCSVFILQSLLGP